MSLGFRRRVVRKLSAGTAFLTAIILSAASARAQQAPVPSIKVNVRLVTLDVVVTDKKGNLVTNLIHFRLPGQIGCHPMASRGWWSPLPPICPRLATRP